MASSAGQYTSGGALRVRACGPLATLQDLGRGGYERFGVPPSGPMDPFALRAANRLVGNPPGAAALEFVLAGPVLQAEQDCLVAVTGCGYRPIINGRRVAAWMAAVVWRGEQIHIQSEDQPGWGYLAVAGGFDVPRVMGSRATLLRAGLGGFHGRALAEGDRLPLGPAPARPVARAARWLPPERRPAYGSPTEGRPALVPVVLGPQLEAFRPEAQAAFLSNEYQVSPTSDRMGYRLVGPPLAHAGSADLISEPLAWGAVQVPADGQPMVMMADRPTAGGYPKIATVASAGLPLMAQAMPGSGRVRFEAISVVEAQARYRALLEQIEKGIE